MQRFVLTTEDSISLHPGDTFQIVYEIVPAEAADEIKWSSDNEQTATVSEDGLFTALAEGQCTVTGTAGEYTVTVEVVCSR